MRWKNSWAGHLLNSRLQILNAVSFIRKQVNPFKSTSARFTSFRTRLFLCSLLKDLYSSIEVKRATKKKPRTNQPLRFTGDMKQEAKQSSSVNTVTFCPTNHIRARKLASHLHPGRWQTHQCLKWVRGAGDGKVKKRNRMFAICTFRCTPHHTPECQHNLSVSSQQAETWFTEGLGKRHRRNWILLSWFLPQFCQLV